MPEDKARKRAVRARMASTGERYTTAARNLGTGLAPCGIHAAGPDGRCPAACEEPRVPGYAEIVAADPPKAEREWSTRARVRIRDSYRAGSVSPWDERRFTPGEELEMLQMGRQGRPVDRDAWWTSADIDGAFILPAVHVQVLEVISDNPPAFADAALPRGRVIAILGPGAEAWDGQGILTVPGVYDFEIRASSGELLGLVSRGGTGAGYARMRAAEPVTYRAVIREDGSYYPPSVKFPAGFIPPDPARAAAAERARWGGTGTGTAAGITVRLQGPVSGDGTSEG